MEKRYDLIIEKHGKKVMGKLLCSNKTHELIVTPLNEYDVTDYEYYNRNNIIELTQYIGSGTDITTP